MTAMVEDLRHYSLEDINAAFVTWRKISEKIPTPCGIIKIISAQTREKNMLERLQKPNETYENRNDWATLREEEKQALDDMVKQAMAYLRSN